MSEHTPGPWKWERTDEGHAVRMGEAIASPWRYESHMVVEYDHGVFAGEVPERDDDDPEARQFWEAEANARLIAAAPDLLDALRGTLSWLTSYPGSGADAAYEAARAAIAKAEGA